MINCSPAFITVQGVWRRVLRSRIDRPAGQSSHDAMPVSQPRFSSLDDGAHVVQVAQTPVFLLSSIGTLINVFSARLGRVSDQVDRIMEAAAVAGHRDQVLADRRLRQLRHGSPVLDIAVILASSGGASTCGAASSRRARPSFTRCCSPAAFSALASKRAKATLGDDRSSLAWRKPRFIWLFQSKINAASYLKCKQTCESLLSLQPRPRDHPASDDPNWFGRSEK